jgi:hypothetical protein
VTALWQEWKEKIGDTLHAIVDRALENSSVALYDQSLRDMEDYIRHVEEATVGMKAAVEGNKRRLIEHQTEAEMLNTRLNDLLKEDQPEKAPRVQQALNIKRQQISETQAQIKRQEGQHAALAHNWQMLKKRLAVLQGERGSVVALMALTKARQAMGSIEYTLGGLASLGEDSEIGTMAGHILQRLHEAEARLTLVDVDVEVARAAAALEEARVEEQLLERRRRLGLVPKEERESREEEAVETPEPEDETPENEPTGPEQTEERPPATEEM